MDFLQEDVDSMQVFPRSRVTVFCVQRELEQWRKENRTLQLELRHEESLTAQVGEQVIKMTLSPGISFTSECFGHF